MVEIRSINLKTAELSKPVGKAGEKKYQPEMSSVLKRIRANVENNPRDTLKDISKQVENKGNPIEEYIESNIIKNQEKSSKIASDIFYSEEPDLKIEKIFEEIDQIYNEDKIFDKSETSDQETLKWKNKADKLVILEGTVRELIKRNLPNNKDFFSRDNPQAAAILLHEYILATGEKGLSQSFTSELVNYFQKLSNEKRGGLPTEAFVTFSSFIVDPLIKSKLPGFTDLCPILLEKSEVLFSESEQQFANNIRFSELTITNLLKDYRDLKTEGESQNSELKKQLLDNRRDELVTHILEYERDNGKFYHEDLPPEILKILKSTEKQQGMENVKQLKLLTQKRAQYRDSHPLELMTDGDRTNKMETTLGTIRAEKVKLNWKTRWKEIHNNKEIERFYSSKKLIDKKIAEINSQNKPVGLHIQDLILLKEKIQTAESNNDLVEFEGRQLNPTEAMTLFVSNMHALQDKGIIPYDPRIIRNLPVQDERNFGLEINPNIAKYMHDWDILFSINNDLTLIQGIPKVDQYLTDVLLHSDKSLISDLIFQCRAIDIDELKNIKNDPNTENPLVLTFASNIAYYLKDLAQNSKMDQKQKVEWVTSVEKKLSAAIQSKSKSVLFGTPPSQRELDIKHTIYYLNALRLFVKEPIKK